MKSARSRLLLVTLFVSGACAAEYYQDFSAFEVGATNFADGAQLFSSDLGGSAAVQDGARKELRLTGSAGGVRSAFVLPALDDVRVYAFSAKWNGSASANFPNGGAGFSFTFGGIAEADLVRTVVQQERGFGRGLCLSVQTDGTAPGFYLLVNGDVIASKAFVSATQFGVNSDARRFFEVDWNYTNGVSVKVDGAPIFTKVATTNFAPQVADRFVWAARTGDFGEEVVLDNIAVVTGGNLSRMVGSGFFSSQRNPNYGPMKAYDDDNDSEFAVFNAQSGFVGGSFAPARRIVFYTLTSGVDGPDPHSWTIEGSTATAGPWTTMVTGDWSFTRRKESRTWPVANVAEAFPFYRISFPTNNSATMDTYIGDLRLFEFKSVQPSQVVAVARNGINAFAVTFAGPVASNYVAQFTKDFSQWTDFATNTVPTNGIWNVTDLAATNQARFYRLRQ